MRKKKTIKIKKERRDYLTKVIVGHKRQGKTTLACAFAKEYVKIAAQKGLKKRVLIHDPSNATGFKQFAPITMNELMYGVKDEDGKRREWEYGVRRLVNAKEFDENNKNYYKGIVSKISRVFSNGLFIADEATVWLDKNNPPDWQKKLIIQHSNFCIDMMLIVHGFMDIPIGLRGNIWRYYIFKVPEEINNVAWFSRRGFPNPQQLFEAYRVAANARRIPLRDNGPTVQKYGVFNLSFEAKNI